MGTLYVVGTPIGNLEDMTLRGLRILEEVSLIAAEDTRRAGVLTARYDIDTPTTSYFEGNKLTKLNAVLGALDAGDVALISEAGMPGLSDPGYELIQALAEQSDGVLAMGQSTLYPLLYNLQAKGLISARWETLPSKRRRKYYRLTDKGQRRLAKDTEQWQAIAWPLEPSVLIAGAGSGKTSVMAR